MKLFVLMFRFGREPESAMRCVAHLAPFTSRESCERALGRRVEKHPRNIYKIVTFAEVK